MKLLSGILALTCLLFSAGCKRDEVREYTAPKEVAAPSPAAAPHDHNHPSTGSLPTELPPTPKLAWAKLPAGWTEKPASAMRAATFVVEQGEAVAEVSVIPLPLTGREVELVNMWRQQMQLPTVSAEESTKLAENVAIGDGQGQLYDLASEAAVIDGKAQGRILVAMLTRGSISWFFKMTGEAKFVAAQKGDFTEFLKGVSFPEGTTTPSAATAPAVEVPAEPTPARNNPGLPQWTVPANWQAQQPGQMLLASYAIGGDNGAATMTVSSFPGDVGGILANVNRWRGQIGLPPVADTGTMLTPVETGDGKAILVDLDNEGQRLIGVMLPRAGASWFFKLKGDSAVVAKEKDAFLAFLQSLKY